MIKVVVVTALVLGPIFGAVLCWVDRREGRKPFWVQNIFIGCALYGLTTALDLLVINGLGKISGLLLGALAVYTIQQRGT